LPVKYCNHVVWCVALSSVSQWWGRWRQSTWWWHHTVTSTASHLASSSWLHQCSAVISTLWILSFVQSR